MEAEEVSDFGAVFRFLHKVVGGVDVNHREQADQVGGVFRVVFKGVGGVGTDFQGPDDIAFDFEVAGQGREVAVEAEDVAGEVPGRSKSRT